MAGWDFTLANYSAVWAFMVQIGLLLIFMLIGNVLRNVVPYFRKCLIPSALIGGALLLVCDIVLGFVGIELVNNRIMQVITYHGLGIGFAALGLKTEKANTRLSKIQATEFGALQGGVYMLQAWVGLLVTVILFLLTRTGRQAVSYVCGLILPLAFGQGPGNALTWDVNFTNIPAAGFAGNGSFGLSLASIGFIVASVVGVLYINIFKKRGEIVVRHGVQNERVVDQSNPDGDEIPDNESVDKFSIQMGFVALVYAVAFGIMCLLAVISDFTNSIAWGFNFLWASLGAMLVKAVLRRLNKTRVVKRNYINNYQMDRVSGFAFDLMIVAGVAAIEINDVKNYVLPILLLTLLGMVVTYIYIRAVSRRCFKGFSHEFFLMSFGTLTGTASNGMILLKEIDPGLRTPTSSLYILSQVPAMVMVAPLLFLLKFAAGSLTSALIACAIFFVLWAAYSVFLFRRSIFKKKYKDIPENVWKE